MGTFSNLNAKRASSQGASLTIAGVGAAFGVTSIKTKRGYTNADVTVTTSLCWEEYTPICRGVSYDVEVPFDAVQTSIDGIFDAQFNANPGTPVTCTLTQTNSIRTISSGCVLENFEVDDSAKDAVRLVFTLRATGQVTFS